jgi:hypothetical protein
MSSRSSASAAARGADVVAAAALAAARQRDGSRGFIGVIEGYCVRDDCATRTVTLHVKEYDHALPSRFSCPACRCLLKFHHVRTLVEYDRDCAAEARASVNAQRWRRAHPDALGVPIGVFLDERLPGDAP